MGLYDIHLFGVLFKYAMFYIMSEARCVMVCQSLFCCAIQICHNVYLVKYNGSCYGMCYVVCHAWCAIHSVGVLCYVKAHVMECVKSYAIIGVPLTHLKYYSNISCFASCQKSCVPWLVDHSFVVLF